MPLYNDNNDVYNLLTDPAVAEIDSQGDGDDNDDENALEAHAEQIADRMVESIDTGAPGGIVIPGVSQILGNVSKALGLSLGTAPAKPVTKKVAQKVVAKLPAKVAAKKSTPRPRIQMPARHATNLNPAGPARRPISNIAELMARVTWAQLAGFASPVTVGIGATVSTTIPVSRDGMVLDWLTNQAAAELLAANLTYGQIPNTIFSYVPLGGWAPLAANRSPVDAVEVRMGANFNVTLNNPTLAAMTLVWTFSGIPDGEIKYALRDPDVADFLRARGPAIQKYLDI